MMVLLTAKDMSKTTNGLGTYSELWMTTGDDLYVVSWIQACRDVHILLSHAIESTTSGNEIVLGHNNNQDTIIREVVNGDAAATKSTPDILSCSSGSYFWIRWEDGLIEVGKGSVVGTDKILDHLDTRYETIKALSFTTSVEAGKGVFLFRHHDGQSYPNSLHIL